MSESRTLPADCDRILHHAVYDACTAASILLDRDAVQSAITARTGFSLVLDAVWRAYQDYARSHNEAHSPASRLPPEVLCSIFRYLPLAGRISTSHVSHHWRNASLAFPAELWSEIPPTNLLDTLSPLLDRTATLGLPVDLLGVRLPSSDGQRVACLCELLKRHLWHIRTLILDAFCTEGQRGDLASLLESAAPMLRHFYLEINHFARPSFQRGIFTGDAPNLERLELGKYATPLHLPDFADAVAFPRIRHVRIGRVRLCPSEPDEVWSVLPKFPALRSLEIWTTPFRDQSGIQQEKIRPPVALDRLAIRTFDAAELVAFDVQSVLKIRTVCVSPLRSATTLPSTGVVPFLLSDIGEKDLEMECIFRSKSVSIRLRQSGDSARARTRTFLHVEPTVLFLPSFQESTFTVVTSLTLYVSADFKPEAWLQSDVLPCLNVEYLTLAYEVWLQGDAASGFPVVGRTFPRLRTLTLLAARSLGADLDAHSLASMVPSLGYTTPKLQSLTLCGFTVRPSSELLYDVADEVRCTEEGYNSFPDFWADT
ncbi:hypothetical protein EXIGLDRAFT_746566 [Exidia glandulosa HHB12029]|uniref:F-box domain-containing protein n=1 Tax=Exidia glandulosa HHB12029 TaxID=1314781 RepID=A0A165LZV0_EXIGL|nr:hypothetical protein EXIGLDRAFT_746566 [Exidia glandulosa HHB12029]